MKEIQETYYTGSEPYVVTYKMKQYMLIVTDSMGNQSAEFFDNYDDSCYIGLSEWDDIEKMDMYELDENGKYVPEK